MRRAGCPLLHPGRPPELGVYLAGDGRRKVLFGTNYPIITADRALQDLDRLGLDDKARELFLAGNARRVFGLPHHRPV